MTPESPLRRAVQPDDLDRFLACDYQRRAVHLPHGGVRRLGDLVSLAEVETALWRAGPDCADRIFLRAPGGPCDRFDRPKSHLRDWALEGLIRGLSLVMIRAEAVFPRLATLCRAAEIDLQGKAQAVVVLSPGHESAGFRDRSAGETFVLQLAGRQAATVRAPACASPLAGQLQGDGEAAARAETLEPNDILYLPGGAAVELRPKGGQSLHVQLGVETYRWLNLIEDMIEAAARKAPALRARAAGGAEAEMAACLAQVLRRDGAALLGDALALRQRRRVAQAAPLPGSELTERVPPMVADGWVARLPGSLCHVETADGRATIEFAARRQARVSGPGFIAPALAFVAASAAPFRVDELPGLATLEEKLILVNRLIEEGLVRPCGPGP